MKTLLILFAVCVSFNLDAQLNGYYSRGDNRVEHYLFNDSAKTFKFMDWFPAYRNNYGKGVFDIVNDSLYLYFDNEGFVIKDSVVISIDEYTINDCSRLVNIFVEFFNLPGTVLYKTSFKDVYIISIDGDTLAKNSYWISIDRDKEKYSDYKYNFIIPSNKDYKIVLECQLEENDYCYKFTSEYNASVYNTNYKILLTQLCLKEPERKYKLVADTVIKYPITNITDSSFFLYQESYFGSFPPPYRQVIYNKVESPFWKP